MCRAETEKITAAQRARIMVLCTRADLDQDERREFAEYLVGKRSTSNMTRAEAGRLIDALVGFVEVHALLALRPPGRGPRAPKPEGRPVYAVDDDGRRWLVAYR